MSYLCKYKTEKRNEKVSLLVFHCFALTTKQMLSLFQKTGTCVHYIIQRNGKILQLADENTVVQHAGLSSWREFKNNINAQSIGIELQNSLMGNKPYTKAQIKSLISLSKGIIKRHNIKPYNIVGHSDIAPFRKPDPAKFFPWEQLAKNGIGIWEKIRDAQHNGTPNKDEEERLLRQIGYDTTDLISALYAFTTRFMPQKTVSDPNIVNTEGKVFAYWLGTSSDKIIEKLPNAPKIYPPHAEHLLKDNEVSARLKQIADIFQKEE